MGCSNLLVEGAYDILILKVEGRTTLNHSTNGVVVDSPVEKTNTCVRHFESLGKFVSHESGIL